MFDTAAGFFVDLFLVVLVVILGAMLVAVALVRRGKVKAHATVMVASFVVFLLALVAFEAQSHFGEPGPRLAVLPLVIHLCFAVPALLLWIWQIAKGKRAREEPAAHRRRGRIVLFLLAATVATGFWVYVATFV